jgi:hypothetical protein
LKTFCCLIFLVLSFSPVAQVTRHPMSVNYQAVGAYSRNFVDVFSATANQAAIANIKSGGFGVYGEQRFMLAELNGYTTIVAAPTAWGVFGFQASYFGSPSYNENELGIIYARKISSAVDIGAKFNYHTFRVAGYGKVSTVNFEAGAIFHLTEKLHSGFHIYNPAGSALGKAGVEKLASMYTFGFGYEASEKLLVSTEIVKQEDLAVGVNASLQYNLHPKVFIRTGISTMSLQSYMTVGLQLVFGRIDVNTAYHAQLGFTPGILLLINFKKPVEE